MTSSTPEAPEPGTQVARHADDLASFTNYCRTNPDERFWQALRNWSGAQSIWLRRYGQEPIDTFHLENRRAPARQSPTVALTNDRDEEETR